MNHVSAIQVKNILAKQGVPRGKKSSYAKTPIDGVATYDLPDGWVMVDYYNAKLAKQDKVDVATHNKQMKPLIHFILVQMSGFEYQSVMRRGANHEFFEHYYRKADK